MERLAAMGAFVAPTLIQLEDALAVSLPLLGAFQDATVTADLWDAERLTGCESCGAARLERIRRMNREGETAPPVTCAHCNSA
jgi:hypothetical protein